MASDTNRPNEGAIREACKRATGFETHPNNSAISTPGPFLILAAQLIEKYEPETLIDPVVKRAREIVADAYGSSVGPNHWAIEAVIRALKEGMNP